MRASRYNEIIKIDDQRYFLFNTVTCAADVVSPEVFHWLNTLSKTSVERRDLPLAVQQLWDRMAARGYITELGAAEEIATVREQFEALRPKYAARRLHALVVTYECNMRCTYCFEQDLQPREDARITPATLTSDMVERIFELIALQDNAVKLGRGRPISLFGGEPLIRKNYDLVETILRRGVGLGYSFTIYTNGLDLVDFVPMLKRYSSIDLHVTLDGIPEVHDAQRPGWDGSPTFDRIVQGIEAARAEGLFVHIRSNVDSRTIDFLPQFRAFTQLRGWDKDLNMRFSLSGIGRVGDHSCASQHLHALQPELPQSKANSRHAWRELLGRASVFELITLSRILRGERPIKFPHYWFCEAHVGLQLYDPEGYIYPCFDLVGREETRIGRYWPNLEMNETALSRWHARDVFSLKRCTGCKYLLLCGGGCACQSQLATGDIAQSICWDFRGFLEEYIPIYFQRGPDAAHGLLSASEDQTYPLAQETKHDLGAN